MLGAGVFSLPQNMAAVAGPAALLLGWLITGVGIIFLSLAMLLLTRLKPELDGGIFTYAILRQTEHACAQHRAEHQRRQRTET